MAKAIELLKEELKKGLHDQILEKLYVDSSRVEAEKERYQTALDSFEKLYGNCPVEVFSAPGRSEIGGNHTDHQHGKVLATSVNIDTIAVVTKTEGSDVILKSDGYPEIRVNLDSLEIDEKEYGSSHGLIRGVAAGLAKRGYKIGGFTAYATSEVLSGSGLSSSAAFEVLIGNILSGLYNEGKADSVLLAQIGQEAENKYFGKPCGLMDQMACSVGGLIQIDFFDPENPVVNKVEVDFEDFGHSLCIIDTKGSHADLTDDYAAIPQEMKSVAKFFGKEFLAEVDEKEFYSKIAEVRKVAGDRAVLRTIHLFNENKRVDELGKALEDKDFESFKRIVRASGDSSYKYLQNVYSNHKIEEMSVAIGIAMSEQILDGEGVTRVHGGGFAGTIQAFVPNDKVSSYKEGIEAVFGKGSCYVLNVRSIGGTRVM